MSWIPLLICLLYIGVESITTNTKSTSIPSENLIPPPISHSVQRYAQDLNYQPTFFQRVAGWFGYGDGQSYSGKKANPSHIGNDGQSQAKQNVIQERYSDLSITSNYQSIQQPHLDQTKQKQKSGCNPCNKVPWMPMFGGGQQQTIPVKGNIQKQPLISAQYQQLQPQYNQQSQYHQLQFQHPPPFQYTNPKVQSFNFYRHNHHQGIQNQHITLPTYSPPSAHSTPQSIQINGITSPEYQPPHHILPIQQTQHHLIPIPLPNLSVTPIPPLYDTKPFRIQTFSHNNFPSYGVPLQIDNIPVQSNAIPIPIIQNPIYIQSSIPQHISTDLQYRSAITSPSPDIEIVKSVSLGEFTSTIEYPPSIVQSPIIDLGSDGESLAKEKYSQPEYLSEPIIVDSNERDSGDSLSSASSKNFTIQNEHDQEHRGSEVIGNTSTKFYEATSLRPKPFKSGESHGRIKTDVEIESSLQTENEKSKTNTKKDRDTPKDLLDSPIFYLKKTSVSPTTKSYNYITKATETFATTKPVIDYSPWSPSTHKGIYTTTTAHSSSTTIHPISSTFSSTETSEVPPPQNIDKKPKQIQIIIPYTNKNQPRPFKANKFQNFETSSGWSHQTNTQDFQDSQESQVVTATVTQAPVKRTTKYLTKILASSLRDLLKKEKSNYTTIDLPRLQKNIDGWTEQEFSMLPNKASTISFRGHSKHIPSEYLTTTTPIKRLTTTTDMIPTTTLEPLYADEEYKKGDYSGKALDNNQIGLDGAHRTTILPMPFKSNKFSETTHELWNKLNVAISPVTKEKVYVVTPQPWKEYNQDDSDLFGNFKSPRFAVRPTPRSGTGTTSSEQKLTLPESVNSLQNDDKKESLKFTPSWVISSFQPSPQVKTIDGHSRVLTVVTPPSYNWKIIA